VCYNVHIEVVMTLEFNQGIPAGCVEWLWDNVGSGNLVPEKHIHTSFSEYAWFYEQIPGGWHHQSGEWKYIHTITVKDPKLGTLFALRWTR